MDNEKLTNEQIELRNQVRKNRLGKRIKAARENCGLSQNDLADQIGLSSSKSISQIEQGKNFPGMDTFFDIVEALQVPAKDLVQGISDIEYRSVLDEIYELAAQSTESDRKLILQLIKDIIKRDEE